MFCEVIQTKEIFPKFDQIVLIGDNVSHFPTLKITTMINEIYLHICPLLQKEAAFLWYISPVFEFSTALHIININNKYKPINVDIVNTQ